MRGLSTEMLIYIPCEDHGLAAVTQPGQKLLRFPSGRKKKGGGKFLFCNILHEFSLAGCHSGPGCVTAAVKQAMSFSGLLSDASPLTEIIFELHISDQIHDA